MYILNNENLKQVSGGNNHNGEKSLTDLEVLGSAYLGMAIPTTLLLLTHRENSFLLSLGVGAGLPLYAFATAIAGSAIYSNVKEIFFT